MSSTEYKIRPLIRKDRKVLAAMIRKLADKIGANGLLNILVADPDAPLPAADGAAGSEKAAKGDAFSRIGVEIIKQLLDILEDDVAAWFADLLGITVEEFDKMPFNIEMIVVEQLMEAPEANDFFSGALRAYNKMKQSVPGLQTRKTA